MTRVLFVTQRLDRTDPLLGFATSLVQGLARAASGVTVIANEVRDPSGLPDNVRVISLGKERGRSQLARGASYLQAVDRELRSCDGLLAHMCPVYLNLAAPIAKLRRRPLLLWFAHPAMSASLAAAELLSDRVLTSLPGAYPRATPKVRAIGQAIDTELFSYREPGPLKAPLRLLALGRTSPAKGFRTILEAVALLRDENQNVRLRIVGPSTTLAEISHREELEGFVASSGLSDVVGIESGVPRDELPALLETSDVLINGMVSGSGDKVVFESMAVGRPVIVSNTAFRPLLAGLPADLTFVEGDPEDLARRVEELAVLSRETHLTLVEDLRARVQGGHSLSHWAEAVVGGIREYRGSQ